MRELTQKRVWFAEALISATAEEVQRLIAKAKEWAESLGKPVVLWMSHKQDAFVTGIAAEFQDVSHRYRDNHFLRDVAKPVLEADSHAKVQMRKKVRGLRTIEQSVLQRHKAETKEDRTPQAPEARGTVAAQPPQGTRLSRKSATTGEAPGDGQATYAPRGRRGSHRDAQEASGSSHEDSGRPLGARPTRTRCGAGRPRSTLAKGGEARDAGEPESDARVPAP